MLSSSRFYEKQANLKKQSNIPANVAYVLMQNLINIGILIFVNFFVIELSHIETVLSRFEDKSRIIFCMSRPSIYA